jgi:hypothetical protein
MRVRRRVQLTNAIASLATVLLVGGCAGTTSTSGPSSAIPTPTVGATLSASIPVTIPEGLRHVWMGPTRQVPGLVPAAITSFLELDARAMRFNGADTGPRVLGSSASLASETTVQFELLNDEAGCHRGDAGSYSFTLSPTGRGLTLGMLSDPCAARVAAIAGDWIRSTCPNPHAACLGDLDPGNHVSIVFTPFIPPTDWQYSYGSFGYTVPDGWSNVEDSRDDYVLVQTGAPDDAGIFVVAGVSAHSQDASCPESPATGVGHTATAISTWIRTVQGLVTSRPAAITIGGLKGFALDVRVDPTATHTCPFSDGKTGASLFSYTDPAAKGFDWGIWGDGHMRLFLLDLGEDRTLMIDIEAQDLGTWKALVPNATEIAKTFRFFH